MNIQLVEEGSLEHMLMDPPKSKIHQALFGKTNDINDDLDWVAEQSKQAYDEFWSFWLDETQKYHDYLAQKEQSINKVLIYQFLGKNHSWSEVGRGLAKGFIENGKQVDLFSTNGITNMPEELLPHVIGYREEGNSTVHGREPKREYDLQISYTAMPNWQHYFKYAEVSAAIWTYEWIGASRNGKRANVLPIGWAKYADYVDFIFAPSEFAANIFRDAGITGKAGRTK